MEQNKKTKALCNLYLQTLVNRFYNKFVHIQCNASIEVLCLKQPMTVLAQHEVKKNSVMVVCDLVLHTCY